MQTLKVDSYTVNAVDCDHVKHIILETVGTDNKPKKEIIACPDEHTASVTMPITIYPGNTQEFEVPVSMVQFSFLINHATTVHKLQGRSVDSLYICNWSYQQNWVYVALSRVRTLKGLYLRKPLDRKKNIRPRGSLAKMLTFFRTTKTWKDPSDD